MKKRLFLTALIFLVLIQAGIPLVVSAESVGITYNIPEEQINVYETKVRSFITAWFEQDVDTIWNLSSRGLFRNKDELAIHLAEPFKKDEEGVFVLKRQLDSPSVRLYRVETIDGKLKLWVDFKFHVEVKDSGLGLVFKGDKKQQVIVELNENEVYNYSPSSEYWIERPDVLVLS